MLKKLSILLAAIAASTAFAMVVSIAPRAVVHPADSSQTVMCWPDEDAHTCWRRAEHRLGH